MFKKDTDYYKAVEINIIKGELIKKWRPEGESPYEDCDDNNDYERDTFDAMTDGTQGDYDDFDGDNDDIMNWAGRD